ncbi:MAG TPA: porin [Acidobacteriota bacterium]|nr:porin [Acidobacteriota bacterium]
MKIQRLFVTFVMLTMFIVPLHSEDNLGSLEEQIGELQEQIRQLEEQRRLLDQQAKHWKDQPEPGGGAAAAVEKKSSLLDVTDRGISVESAQDDFRLRFRGYFQIDNRTYLEAAPSAVDTFLLRRIRPVVELTVFKNFDFRIMPDFAGSSTNLQDAYFNWTLAPEFQIRAGKMKSPIGLERLQSATALPFTERGFPTAMVPNRDIGFMLRGLVLQERLEYGVGLFDGGKDGSSVDSDTNDGKDLVLRLFAQPFARATDHPLAGLGVGIAGTYGQHEAPPTSYRTTGQQVFFRFNTGVVNDGRLWRLAPQAYYYRGPFGILGEWTLSSQQLRNDTQQAEVRNVAWQMVTSYVLTGEDSSYGGVRPRRNLEFGQNSWGAFEVVARVGRIDIDDNAFPFFASSSGNAERVTNVGVGLNWYLNSNIKFAIDYETNLMSGGGSFKDEHTLFNRIQFGF